MDLSYGINLTTGFPPTINNYYAHTKRGVYIRSKGKEYREEVACDVRVQIPQLVSIGYSIFLSVVLYPPDRRVRDLDNYMKSLLDALTKAGVWDDDSCIDQLHIYRGERVRGGLVKLRIAECMPIVHSSLDLTDLI